MSSEWISSLFNEGTERYTPLDFRLTAAAQFRYLSILCSVLIQSVESLKGEFLASNLISTRVLSQISLNAQVNGIFQKFNTQFSFWMTSTRGPEIIILIIRQLSVYSTVYTNGFQILVPGSNQSQTVNGFYPLHDNASFNKVTAYVSELFYISIWFNYELSNIVYIIDQVTFEL